jgi:outer membrane protein assembly factor BamE (lipoprotein component of BamABCDE complex)
VRAKSGLSRLVSWVRLSVWGTVLAAMCACTPIYRNHGYVPRDEDLAAVKVGESTQEDVAFAVGRPSAIGVLTGSGWYYVGSRFRQIGIKAPQEIDRQVVAISFDDKGIVSNVERFGLQDGEVVTISRRVTSSNVKGVSFLRQLLGNIGNLGAGELLNADN